MSNGCRSASCSTSSPIYVLCKFLARSLRTWLPIDGFLTYDRILPKLNAEADAHLGPGGPANAKRGTLDVHRGGNQIS